MFTMEKIIILTYALLGCLPLGHSYPSGTPERACSDMFPQHGPDSQMSKSPYFIQTHQDSYYPGSNVTVVIGSTNGTWFKGFFLQARSALCGSSDFEMPVGTFFTQDSEVQRISCHGDMGKNAVTHTSRNMKQLKTFTWTNNKGGDIFFQATFVQDFNTFWTGVKSDIIEDTSNATKLQYDFPSPSLDCPTRDKVNMYPMVSLAVPVLADFSIVTVFSILMLF